MVKGPSFSLCLVNVCSCCMVSSSTLFLPSPPSCLWRPNSFGRSLAPTLLAGSADGEVRNRVWWRCCGRLTACRCLSSRGWRTGGSCPRCRACPNRGPAEAAGDGGESLLQQRWLSSSTATIVHCPGAPPNLQTH
jgi:hypothetical protein